MESKSYAGVSPLPDFLRVTVDKGIINETTARRIELYRRTRGLGVFENFSALVNIIPDPNLTFESYIECKGNAFALQLAQTVATKTPSTLPYNPLYIYADVGLGKTHLMSAIANGAANRSAILVNTADLDAEFERARRLNSRAELLQWLVSPDILMVDDIQMAEGHEDLQKELFTVLNHMIRAGRWVVISSDVPPTRLSGMEARLLSRLGGGVIVSLQMGNKDERMELLRHFMQERPVSHDVIDYLASHVTENIRRLKAVVAQLFTMSELTSGSVTLDMARVVALADTDGGYNGVIIEKNELEEIDATRDMADRFKKMLSVAESEEEQALALQIALGERIRQLRKSGEDPEGLARLESSLDILREGRLEEAISCITS